VRSVIIK